MSPFQFHFLVLLEGKVGSDFLLCLRCPCKWERTNIDLEGSHLRQLPFLWLPCSFWLYSVLSDWLLLKVPEWSPGTLLSTTVSVFLLSSMYSLGLKKVRFFLLLAMVSFPVVSLGSI